MLANQVLVSILRLLCSSTFCDPDDGKAHGTTGKVDVSRKCSCLGWVHT